MSHLQSGILASPVPKYARHLFFNIADAACVGDALRTLAQLADGKQLLVGIGEPVSFALDRQIPGLRSFAPLNGPGAQNPATQHALWCWITGAEACELAVRSLDLQALLAPAFTLASASECFRYKSGHDLTGYEDGTENPVDDDAIAAAAVESTEAGLDQSSFAAIQQWVHDLPRFNAHSPLEKDHMIGRQLSDNEELEDAPESAHVKRTAQESFSPEAFMVRRSMPFVEGTQAGLMFLCFAKTLDVFEAQLKRMSGLEDGITDALYGFSRPITGGYYWCPAISDGHLNLGALGL